MGIRGKFVVFELLVLVILECFVLVVKEIFKFFVNNWDIVVVVDEIVVVGEVFEICCKVGGEKLVGVNLFDVY